MRRRHPIEVVVLAVVLAGATPGWRALPSALEHRRELHGDTMWELVRVDLRRFRLVVADARRGERKRAPVPALRAEVGGVAAINGTFFDERERPLGLLVSDGRELNPLRNVSWWAVLGVYGEGPGRRIGLRSTADFRGLPPDRRAGLRFAIQAGPRAVVGGAPPHLRRQRADRSAICVRGPTQVILVATHGRGVEFDAVARRMAGPLGCRDGLMLDGGRSTALDVPDEPRPITVRGGWPVPNAVVVIPDPPAGRRTRAP